MAAKILDNLSCYLVQLGQPGSVKSCSGCYMRPDCAIARKAEEMEKALEEECEHPSDNLWKLHHVSGGDTSFIYEDYWCRECGAIGIRPAGDRRDTEIKWHLPKSRK